MIEAELADGRILEFPDGTDPAVIQSTVKKLISKAPAEKPPNWRDYLPFGKEDVVSKTLAAPIEAGLSLGTGGLAAAKGGADAIYNWGKNELIGAGLIGGMDDTIQADIASPVDAVTNALQKYTYQPRNQGSRALRDTVAVPLQAYGEKGTEFGDRAQAATGSPIYGAGTEAVWNLLPSILGARSPRVQGVPKKANPVVEAIRNRLPGGTQETAKNIITETAGTRIDPVKKALIEAERGKTAGQATAPAQSTETAALWKMSETEKPSDFRAIYKQQEADRLASLQREAGTPEAQQAQKNVRSSVADALYEKGRTGTIPESEVTGVLSKVDKLIEDNPGHPELQSALRSIRSGLIDKQGVIRTDSQQVMSTVNGLRKLIENKDAGNLKGPLISLKKDVVRLSDDFVEAERFYAKASRDITQGEIFQELVDILKPKLKSSERATQYVNAITGRGQKLTTKKATGKTKPPRETFEEQLEPRQVELVKHVEGDLKNNALYSELADEGASKMNKIAGTAWTSEKLRILDTKMVILNNIWKRIEGRTKQSTIDRLADLNKPENRAELIKIYEEAVPVELAILREPTFGVGVVAPGAVAGEQ